MFLVVLIMVDVHTMSQKQVRCQSEVFRGRYYEIEIMPREGENYMRKYEGHEMSRDIFLTSVDKFDDFIYRVHMVLEEFQAKTEKGGQCWTGADLPPWRNPLCGG